MIFPYTLIDLTHTIDANICTWDGDCGFNMQIAFDYPQCNTNTKFRVMKFQMHAGIGTHMDAPSHCIPGAATIDSFNLTDLCMPCVVIDVSHKVHERYSIMPNDIAAFENQYGLIPNGSCVMIKTGWEQFWAEPAKYRNNLLFPCVSLETAELLLKRGVQALGIDTLSPDRPEDGYAVHQAFLSKGKILIENVAHLDDMPACGAFVMILPLKIQNATEAPIRLVGLLKNNIPKL